MNFSDPSIQLEESEPSHGDDDDDENRDSCALRQSEYDDSQGIVYGTMMDHNNPRSRMTRGYRTHNMTTTLVVSCRSTSMNPSAWTMTTTTVHQIRLSTSIAP
jgi:hypothetical protein